MDQRRKKAHLKAKKKVIDTLNSSLSPLESAASYLKEISLKTKESIPWLIESLSELADEHIISFGEEKDIKKIDSILTKNIIRKLPHIDEGKIDDLLFREKRPFLQALTLGLGVGNANEKEYTIIRQKKLFRRVLIANRGEIALRIIRACRELGIETIAIYSDQEKDSLPLKFADRSFCIGKSKNYLNIKKIIDAAKKLGADAIHPGYGFLSENAKFAQLCEKKKIKFIGPKSKEILLLGDKVSAKKKMKESHVPIIEGFADPLTDSTQAVSIAKEIGFPIILKAKSGGGGKGMRIVRIESEIESAYHSAQSEALASFGDGTLYIEKYVEDPRHIEFQILADRHGHVIHLGERDCSIQRRHQKLIEESPSPALTSSLREKMGGAAVNAIKAIGYEGAGTVEFLLDKSGNFYFIEMNTRIQVEHGVTELVTGVDLVKEQIKLAAGAKLSHEQKDIKIEGWAIECRINADDPSHDFAPSPGTVSNYLAPGGPGIKISSPCHSGYKVSPHFDSLLALLMCFGKDREEALSRMRRSLDEYVIDGVKTTIPFHKLIFNHPQFIKGKVTTSFIDRYGILLGLKKSKPKKLDSLPKEKKMLIVTSAISEHLSKKTQVPSGGWAKASVRDPLHEFDR